MLKLKCRKGDFVLSLAGRDEGRIHLVIDADENYAFIADGDTRKVQKPKKKKIKHLRLLEAEKYEGEITNRMLREKIRELKDNVK